MWYNRDMMMEDKQFSSNPEEKLKYLRKQKHLIELSIAMIEYNIKNPPAPIDHNKITKELALIPYIGEYRNGHYHYYAEKELAEQQERLAK